MNDWIYSTPEDAGFDALKLRELDKEIAQKKGDIGSLLILKDDKIVYENYAGNCSKDKPMNISTVTQSIMSALVGIAIDNGIIRDENQTIGDFFPDASAEAKAVTIKELLTMSVNYKWVLKEPIDRIRRQKDWCKFILDSIGKKKQKFLFSMGNSHILSAIISQSSEMTTLEYADKYLFKPIGITSVKDSEMKTFSKEEVFGNNNEGWVKDPQGIYAGGWGISMTPEDLLRFGKMYIDGGKYNGTQIISEEWIKKTTSPFFEDSGYSWWIRNAKDPFVYMAVGIGGTNMYCIPDYNMVISFVSNISKFDTMPMDRWKLVSKVILAALK